MSLVVLSYQVLLGMVLIEIVKVMVVVLGVLVPQLEY